MAGFARSCEGVAAIEFALIVPVLCFALLAMTDIGFAIGERMGMDQALRTGAEIALADPGTGPVFDAVEASAAPQFTVVAAPQTPGADGFSLDVERFYACPETPDTAVAATTTCAGSTPTAAFYELSATKDYSGLTLPSFAIGARLKVQIR
ncbi:TadE/TadG family type IV pilus assembly protein [Jiella sp. M17.18]|uniref:TadE/TadG family type IV pilus assembly protein n=1 Tax=Jiella sp. M17.18 TaxID=3234247 RepID=UPI0034E03148